MSAGIHIGQRNIVSAWIKAHVIHDKRLKEDGSVQGVIYLAWASGTPFWKVGFSGQLSGVKRRINSIQTGCPHEIILRGIKPQSPAHQESTIHSFMRSHRIHGEWFRYNEWIRQFVKTWPYK